METVHLTMDSDRLASIMELPESLRHREVEVVVFARLRDESAAVAEESASPKKKRKEIMGSLAQYADPELRKLEKEAWGMAVMEKFGKKP